MPRRICFRLAKRVATSLNLSYASSYNMLHYVS